MSKIFNIRLLVVVVTAIVMVFMFRGIKETNSVTSENLKQDSKSDIIGRYECETFFSAELRIYSNGVADLFSMYTDAPLVLFQDPSTGEWLPKKESIEYAGPYNFYDEKLIIHGESKDYVLNYDNGDFIIKAGDSNLPDTKGRENELLRFKKVTDKVVDVK